MSLSEAVVFLVEILNTPLLLIGSLIQGIVFLCRTYIVKHILRVHRMKKVLLYLRIFNIVA
jgi:hypothetical protein